MAKRLILKTSNDNGIPSRWEISDFESKNGVVVGSVKRLYVSFKVGKRRKLKRLRLDVQTQDCELCGSHTYASGSVGKEPFDKEIY